MLDWEREVLRGVSTDDEAHRFGVRPWGRLYCERFLVPYFLNEAAIGSFKMLIPGFFSRFYKFSDAGDIAFPSNVGKYSELYLASFFQQ